jgi:hypothetical protein
MNNGGMPDGIRRPTAFRRGQCPVPPERGIVLSMTSAARACAVAAIAALAFSLTGAAVLVPGHRSSSAAGTVPGTAGGTVLDGFPMIPAGAGARTHAGVEPDVSNITSADSLNWAGYAVSKSHVTFRLIRATFFVPYLDCAKSPAAALSSDWVGLDGFNAHADSVEQGGIAANCSAKGKASYFGWYEMFPRAETRVPIKVAAGDSITASVSYDGKDRDYKITLTDNTRGSHFSVLRKCPHVRVGGKLVSCPRSSAEVISEAPATESGKHLVIAPLADYGAISFAAVDVTDNRSAHGGIVSAHWNATKIIQLESSGGPLIAHPTPTQANMFDNYWLRSG